MKLKSWLLSLTLIFLVIYGVNSYHYSNDFDIIYTQITYVSWPPNYHFNPPLISLYTDFSFQSKFQIINNGSKINAHINKAPYLIPRMNACLINTSLEPVISYVFLDVGGDIVIEEGITNITRDIGFSISDYRNQSLPLGNYTFWFDIIDVLKYEIKLIPFYTTINVTENQVIIIHQGINTTITYPEKINETDITLISSITALVVLLISRKKLKN